LQSEKATTGCKERVSIVVFGRHAELTEKFCGQGHAFCLIGHGLKLCRPDQGPGALQAAAYCLNTIGEGRSRSVSAVALPTKIEPYTRKRYVGGRRISQNPMGAESSSQVNSRISP
jgi:hypothetical protein